MKLAITLTTLLLAAGGAATASALPCDSGCDSGTGGGTTIPGGTKNPKPTPEPDNALRHVEVKLVSVKAKDTEDSFGDDEYYAFGSVSSGGQQMNSFVTSEFALGNGQTRALNQTMFSGNLSGDDPLDVSIDSFDHDAGEVLKHVPETVKLIGDKCKQFQDYDPTLIAAACATAAPVIREIFAWLSPRLVDSDDTLDMWGIRKTHVRGYPYGTTHESHDFSGTTSFGAYAYTVNYDVTVTAK